MLSAEGIIISCGKDSSIPHHPGKGLLKPFQTIVCDIYFRKINLIAISLI